MSFVTAFDAKPYFAELLERVARGEETVIPRHNKPGARIVPEGRPRLDHVRLAVAGIRALLAEIQARTRRQKPLSDAEVRKAIEEGRR